MRPLLSSVLRMASSTEDVALRDHLKSVIAVSVSEELVDDFWGSFDQPNFKVLKKEKVDIEWVGEPTGGYGHGDDWSPTEYAEGSVPVAVPKEVEAEGQFHLSEGYPLSPGASERMLESAIRKGIHPWFKDAVGEFLHEQVMDGGARLSDQARRKPWFSVDVKSIDVRAREVEGILTLKVRLTLNVDIDAGLLDIDPPEPDFDPPEPDDFYDSRYDP